MNFAQAVVLGIVEGITEFLPISSTAHLTLTAELLGLAEIDFVKSFTIIVQLGAILPVAWLYLKRYATNWAVHQRVLAGFLPTALIGFVLYTVIKKFLLGNVTLILWTLTIGGILLIAFELYYRRRQTTEAKLITSIQAISLPQAALIGCCQALAVIPGVSRSAATIVSGLSLGLQRSTIVEFSFILAVPVMLAATGYDLLKNASSFTADQVGVLLIGFVTAAIFAQLSITFLLKFVKKHTFIPFGIYRMVIAGIFALALAFHWL